jgi:hypothetical protein
LFAVRFDDLKRKALPKGTLMRKITTCFSNTPEFEQYMGLFLMPENNTLEVFIEDDNKTYTFYTVITDPRTIELELERERKKNDKQHGYTGTNPFV